MTLKTGDILTIDGVEFVVMNVYQNTDHYLLKEKNAPAGYYHSVFRSAEELNELRAQGRLLVGGWNEKVKGGNPSCFHEWRRYMGAIPASLYDYCTRCDAKKSVDLMGGEK
jgi:hypothetical protein